MAKKPQAPMPGPTQSSNFEERHKQMVARGEHLFSKRRSMESLWQEIAENFYPERADFTYSRSLGSEFADNLATSYPLLMRRDLGNSFSSLLRQGEWMKMTTDRPDDDLDTAAQQWLEAKTKVQRRAMADRIAQFTRATKECDHDFAAFGQGVISSEVNRAESALLFRNWHLRDVAWCEQSGGRIGFIVRKWKPTAMELKAVFKDRIHSAVQRKISENNGAEAYSEVNVRHYIIPIQEYDGPLAVRARFKFISCYIDVDNKHVLEEVQSITQHYTIPRWQTVSGSQYSYSPATVAGLPDARLLQALTFTLLKAGEKAVDPPMIATEEAVRSPIDIYPGGVTWVSEEYDERLGEVLRPLAVDSRGLPVGFNMQQDLRTLMQSSFFLDKLNLPQQREMTAYETSQRIQEYIRQLLPLFEPIELEYSAPLCEQTFDLLMANGAFGPVEEIPESLQGQTIRFKFESPISEAGDQKLVQSFQITKELLVSAAELDPDVVHMVDAKKALRDALRGGGSPAKWLVDEKTVAEISAANAEKRQAQETAAMVGQGAAVAEQVGMAGQALNQASAA